MIWNYRVMNLQLRDVGYLKANVFKASRSNGNFRPVELSRPCALPAPYFTILLVWPSGDRSRKAQLTSASPAISFS